MDAKATDSEALAQITRGTASVALELIYLGGGGQKWQKGGHWRRTDQYDTAKQAGLKEAIGTNEWANGGARSEACQEKIMPATR